MRPTFAALFMSCLCFSGRRAISVMVASSNTFKISKECTLHLALGDLTEFSGDAIVNAANERMLGGGGVDGAIHRAAGPDLYKECKQVPEVMPGVRCPTGEARITKGYELPAKYVIHTVGPIYESDSESAPLLASAYSSSLQIANEYGLVSIAFPAISTGVYGYPKNKAAEVSLKAVAESSGQVAEVHFILFGQDTMDAFMEAAQRQFSKPTVEQEEAEGGEL